MSAQCAQERLLALLVSTPASNWHPQLQADTGMKIQGGDQIMAQGRWPRNGPIEQRGGADSVQVDRVGPLVGGNAILHHLGFVVSSISAVADEFAVSISARWDGEIIHDPIQRVRVAFFSPVDPRNPVFELVEPASEVSPVGNFLKKGGGLHHVCYEIDDLESGLREARGVGLVTVADPAPAVAFGGRRIAWVCSKRRLLVELLERGRK
jgi:methylmalonyl-CoA/ethylmalonyl-CoA epimerase